MTQARESITRPSLLSASGRAKLSLSATPERHRPNGLALAGKEGAEEGEQKRVLGGDTRAGAELGEQISLHEDDDAGHRDGDQKSSETRCDAEHQQNAGELADGHEPREDVGERQAERRD